MNLKRSQAMAPMQKDDMKMGKFCAAFRNLHRNSANGREAKVKWTTVESRVRGSNFWLEENFALHRPELLSTLRLGKKWSLGCVNSRPVARGRSGGGIHAT